MLEILRKPGGTKLFAAIQGYIPQSKEKKFKKLTDEELNTLKIPILEKYEKEGNPYYASARLWDDGIISPLKTRSILIQALIAVTGYPIPETRFPVFRM